jgi:hypothetical protein
MGIFADPKIVLKSSYSRFYSDEDFQFPLPENFPPGSDFDLPFDLQHMVQELGGTAGMIGSSQAEKPTKFLWIPKSMFC